MKLSTNVLHDIKNNFFERDAFKSHMVADVTKSSSIIYRWKANGLLNKKPA